MKQFFRYSDLFNISNFFFTFLLRFVLDSSYKKFSSKYNNRTNIFQLSKNPKKVLKPEFLVMAEDLVKKQRVETAPNSVVYSSPERGADSTWMRQRRRIVGGTSILRCRDVLQLGNNGADGCGSSHVVILLSLFVILQSEPFSTF